MTPHNSAKKGDIAKVCLMPGDPLRAKWIAETYLTDPVCFNQTRGMLGFTGSYQGKRVSVMGHGMGIPSIGIYSHELFSFYDVDAIIRVGSAGGLQPDMQLGDLVAAQGACTNSSYCDQFGIPGTYAPICSYDLLKRADAAAEKLCYPLSVGNILASDVFYAPDAAIYDKWRQVGVCAIEMECSALYLNAALLGKKALGLLTISDIIGDPSREMTPDQRQTSMDRMVQLALEVARQVA